MDVYDEKIVQGFTGSSKRVAFGGLGLDKIKTGERIDPRVQAAYNLNKTLEKYPDFTKEARNQIQADYLDCPGIATVNLELLASVLNFLKDYPEPTPDDFRDSVITEYFTRLYPTKTLNSSEKNQMNIRIKAAFLRYIVAVQSFNQADNEN
jgi:hypothetical protein